MMENAQNLGRAVKTVSVGLYIKHRARSFGGSATVTSGVAAAAERIFAMLDL